MTDKNRTCVMRRETGWSSGFQRNLSTGVNRSEVQIFEECSLIEVFRSDSDQCGHIIESEAGRYLKRMQEENPDKAYEMKAVLNEDPYRSGPRLKGWGC